MAKGQIKQAQERIDKRQFETLCGMQCTEEEICSVFEVSKDTLLRWCKNTYESTATIPEGGTYQPNTIIRRFGQCCQMANNAMELNGQGYYDVAVTATVIGTVAGNVTMTVYQDGAAVPGMNATQTIKAVGDTVTLGTSGIVRVYCGKNSSTLTVVIGGQAVTGSNLAIDITKQ